MEFGQTFHLELEPRLKKFLVVILVVLGIVGLRLYYLQGIRGKFYRLFSEENSIREIVQPALRGMLLDRNGIPLVENRPAFDLIITPQYVVDHTKLFETLEKNLEIPPEKLESKWAVRFNQAAYQPISILKDVSLDTVSWVKAHKNPWENASEEIDLRGVDIRLRFEREYPDGDVASHVMGYLREIDAERLKKYQKEMPEEYQLGDDIGVQGLEKIWDLTLRGENGFQQKVVNARGREISYPGIEEELTQKEPVNGYNLKLTLDGRLQKMARDYFKGKAGAAVAIDPRDGAVLLLYSAPSFDLNLLGGEYGNEYWREISGRPEKFLLNRAIQSAYPPGSTYKIVNGAAALQEGVAQPEEKIHCAGGLRFGNRVFGCWRKGGHGMVDYFRSLVASCDVYYYTMGLRLGVDRLAKYARAFGLGSPTGIELPDEKGGLIPTAEWKLKYRKEPWQEGETLSISIGQGYDLITPLQGAVMVATVVNGGKAIRPYLVQSTIDPDDGKENAVEREAPAPRKEAAVLDPKVLERVKAAMLGVIADSEGTAHSLSVLKIPMGGKTGTAQVVALGKGCAGGKCGDHAWFVAFAPAEDPKIAVAVLVEHGGHGGAVSAPLAGQLIKIYLEEQK